NVFVSFHRMQNAFWRFKHYRLGSDTANDAKENHATECLAACLRFSPGIKQQFFRFLCEGDPLSKITSAELRSVVVSTQQSIDDGCFLHASRFTFSRFCQFS